MEITREQYRKLFAEALKKELEDVEEKCGSPGPMMGLGFSLFSAAVCKRIEEDIFGEEQKPEQEKKEDADVLPFS